MVGFLFFVEETWKAQRCAGVGARATLSELFETRPSRNCLKNYGHMCFSLGGREWTRPVPPESLKAVRSDAVDFAKENRMSLCDIPSGISCSQSELSVRAARTGSAPTVFSNGQITSNTKHFEHASDFGLPIVSEKSMVHKGIYHLSILLF